MIHNIVGNKDIRLLKIESGVNPGFDNSHIYM